jgi:hypothetical protein
MMVLKEALLLEREGAGYECDGWVTNFGWEWDRRNELEEK